MAGLVRKRSVVGTVGEIGASYAVYENNWTCSDCKTENYARRPRCMKCRARKPENGGGLVESELPAPDGSDWREALDVSTQQIYYWNSRSGETKWERPADMGAAPAATGWYGRGRAGSSKAAEYVFKVQKLQGSVVRDVCRVCRGVYPLHPLKSVSYRLVEQAPQPRLDSVPVVPTSPRIR